MVEVLDRGFVELQGVMGNDLTIINSARVSYLGETKGVERDKKLLRYLYENKHTGPFEHVVFRFRVKAPLLVWWQWVRHRTASFNLQSGRYVEFQDDEFYIPNEWRLQSGDNKQGSEGISNYSSVFKVALEQQIENAVLLYQSALGQGIAKEQARLFLPAYCLYYTGVITHDAHNLMHFLKLRLHPHAQYEIRQYAKAVFSLFEQKLPWTAELFKEDYLENHSIEL